MEKKMKHLGCINGWAARVWTKADGSKFVEKEDTTPQEFKDCQAQKHMMEVYRTGRCASRVMCHICKIEYDVDSSD